MLISIALLLDSIVLSVIVYVLRQNCRAAGWRWDTKKKLLHNFEKFELLCRYKCYGFGLGL
jgi:hypothetical protein